MEHTIAIFQDADAIDEIFADVPDHLDVEHRKSRPLPQGHQGHRRRSNPQRNHTHRADALGDCPPDTKLMTYDAVENPPHRIASSPTALDALDEYDVLTWPSPGRHHHRGSTTISIHRHLRRGTGCAVARPCRSSARHPGRRPTRGPGKTRTLLWSLTLHGDLRYRPDKPIHALSMVRSQREDHRADRHLHRQTSCSRSAPVRHPHTRGRANTTNAACKVAVVKASDGIGADSAALATSAGATV